MMTRNVYLFFSQRIPQTLYYLAITAFLGLTAKNASGNVGLDGIGYISIAKDYAGGHWKEAVNAYWSPLLSWLLAPFVALGIDGDTAFRILLVVCSVAILILGQRLINLYTKDTKIASVIYQSSMLILLFHAVQYAITPDLFVVFWSILLAFMLSKSGTPFKGSTQWLILLGALGAIGYFTKAVILPIFVFVVVAWFLFGKAPRGTRFLERLRKLAIPFLTMAVIAAIWIIPLSIKYGEVTSGNSGKYSLAYTGPHTVGHPVINGLLPPPNKFAVTPWEDPSVNPYIPWSPLDSWDDFGYYVDRILETNIPGVFSVLSQLSPFLVGTFWTIIILLILGLIDRRQKIPLIAISLIGGTFALAYSAIHIFGGGRYLWSILVLNLIAISILLGSWELYAPKLQKRWLLWTGALLVPLAMLIVWYGSLFPASKDKYHPLARNLAPTIEKHVPPRARFASNLFPLSSLLSYNANLSGYGSTQPGLTVNDPLVQKALRQNNIEYYFFVEYPDRPVDLSGLNVVLKTTVNVGDSFVGLPQGSHNAYLIKLK